MNQTVSYRSAFPNKDAIGRARYAMITPQFDKWQLRINWQSCQIIGTSPLTSVWIDQLDQPIAAESGIYAWVNGDSYNGLHVVRRQDIIKTNVVLLLIKRSTIGNNYKCNKCLTPENKLENVVCQIHEMDIPDEYFLNIMDLCQIFGFSFPI